MIIFRFSFGILLRFSFGTITFSLSHTWHTATHSVFLSFLHSTLSSLLFPFFLFVLALLDLLIETFRLARTLMNRIRSKTQWWSTTRTPRGVQDKQCDPSAKLYPRAIARDVADDGPPLSTDRRREKSFIIEQITLDVVNGCDNSEHREFLRFTCAYFCTIDKNDSCMTNRIKRAEFD